MDGQPLQMVDSQQALYKLLDFLGNIVVEILKMAFLDLFE